MHNTIFAPAAAAAVAVALWLSQLPHGLHLCARALTVIALYSYSPNVISHTLNTFTHQVSVNGMIWRMFALKTIQCANTELGLTFISVHAFKIIHTP